MPLVTLYYEVAVDKPVAVTMRESSQDLVHKLSMKNVSSYFFL